MYLHRRLRGGGGLRRGGGFSERGGLKARGGGVSRRKGGADASAQFLTYLKKKAEEEK